LSEPNQVWEFGLRNRVESFRYPAIHPQSFPAHGAFDPSGINRRDSGEQAPQPSGAALEASRKQGFQEGEIHAAAAAGLEVQRERASVTAAIQEFAGQRAEYFRRVEGDVVKLALAIARKVLHREAQLDPLLLAGVVRVALDQMQAGTRLVLRTWPEGAEAWRSFCEANLGGERSVEVVPDSSLEAYRCVLEAEVGSVEISLERQLEEIESGFFDLLQHRPGASR